MLNTLEHPVSDLETKSTTDNSNRWELDPAYKLIEEQQEKLNQVRKDILKLDMKKYFSLLDQIKALETEANIEPQKYLMYHAVVGSTPLPKGDYSMDTETKHFETLLNNHLLD